MLFCKSIEIPANTLQSAPQRTEIKLTSGVIDHIWVWWWEEAGNLCGARLLYAEFQLWPLSKGEWFGSHPFALDFAERYELEDEPYSVTIEAYNEDDTFAHTVWIGVSILREDPMSLPFAVLA